MKIGTCKLCLTSNASLQGSHYIPKGVYRQLREGGAGNPNPWLITKDRSVQSSKQLKANLFCDVCEALLSRHGEDWVLKHFLKANGEFKLQSILERHPPSFFSDNDSTRVYRAAQIPEIDVAALSYFAASIFWRGSIHGWNGDGSLPVPLGPYGEPLRRYLRTEESFPENMALLLAVRVPDGHNVSRLPATPVAKRLDRVRIFKFPMPGLAFALAVGRGLNQQMRRLCFVRGDGNPLAATSVLESIIQDDAVKYISRQKLLRSNR